MFPKISCIFVYYILTVSKSVGVRSCTMSTQQRLPFNHADVNRYKPERSRSYERVFSANWFLLCATVYFLPICFFFLVIADTPEVFLAHGYLPSVQATCPASRIFHSLNSDPLKQQTQKHTHNFQYLLPCLYCELPATCQTIFKFYSISSVCS